MSQSNYKSGLVSISFRPLSVDEIMDLCEKNNLKYIEWGSDVHAPCDNAERLAYLAAEQQKRGLILVTKTELRSAEHSSVFYRSPSSSFLFAIKITIFFLYVNYYISFRNKISCIY